MYIYVFFRHIQIVLINACIFTKPKLQMYQTVLYNLIIFINISYRTWPFLTFNLCFNHDKLQMLHDTWLITIDVIFSAFIYLKKNKWCFSPMTSGKHLLFFMNCRYGQVWHLSESKRWIASLKQFTSSCTTSFLFLIRLKIHLSLLSANLYRLHGLLWWNCTICFGHVDCSL